MMDFLGDIMLVIYLIFFVVFFMLLIYLIFRRIRIKKTENFEDRDN